jgi:hypothetical protein
MILIRRDESGNRVLNQIDVFPIVYSVKMEIRIVATRTLMTADAERQEKCKGGKGGDDTDDTSNDNA